MSKACRQDISVGNSDSATGFSFGAGLAASRVLVCEGEVEEDLRENQEDTPEDEDGVEEDSGCCVGWEV